MVWRETSCLHHPYNKSKVGFTNLRVGKETPVSPSFCFLWIPNEKLPWYYYSLPSIRSPCIVNNYLVRTIPPQQHPRCPSLVNPFLVASCSSRIRLLCHCLHEYVVLSFHHQYFLIPVPKVSSMLLGDSKRVLSQQDFSSDGRPYFNVVLFPVAWIQYGDQNALRITEVQLFLCFYLASSWHSVSYFRRPGSIPYPVAVNPNLSSVLGPAMAQAG